MGTTFMRKHILYQELHLTRVVPNPKSVCSLLCNTTTSSTLCLFCSLDEKQTAFTYLAISQLSPKRILVTLKKTYKNTVDSQHKNKQSSKQQHLTPSLLYSKIRILSYLQVIWRENIYSKWAGTTALHPTHPKFCTFFKHL